MEFETLKKDNRQKWIVGAIAILAIASVVFFVSTRANYKTTQRLNLINKVVNWNPTDLEIVSIQIKDGDSYRDIDTVPTSGYTLSSESYCEVNGNRDTSIQLEYKDGKVNIGISKKGTKCYLIFEVKATTISEIVASLTKSTRTSFSSPLTANTTGTIYTAEDNDGTSYYYAGSVDNNWVYFGGFYWRIIRINGDGTMRLIYNGTTTSQTGTSTYIGASRFNSYDYGGMDNAYVGYMYGTSGSSTYEETHTNINNSNAKQTVDTWYATNLNKIGIKEHIDTNAGFCGDRTSNTSYDGLPSVSGGYGTINTYYGTNYRLSTNKAPSLKCTNSNDLYTVSGANKGNKALTYPVGLISADEVAYAGGVAGESNTSYYLYTDNSYWTISPSMFAYNHGVFGWYVSGGTLSSSDIFEGGMLNDYGVRPVVNLKVDTKLIGDGTTTSPYKVV